MRPPGLCAAQRTHPLAAANENQNENHQRKRKTKTKTSNENRSRCSFSLVVALARACPCSNTLLYFLEPAFGRRAPEIRRADPGLHAAPPRPDRERARR